MNTEEQAFAIAKKIGKLFDPNKGVFKITTYQPTKTVEVRGKNLYTGFNQNGFYGDFLTFTNDINTLTVYDVYNIKDVS